MGMMRCTPRIVLVACLITACDDTAEESAVDSNGTMEVAPATSAASDTSIAAFWGRFRDVVVRNDVAGIVALSARDFQTRGEMDDEPWVTRDSAALVAIADSLLTTDPGLGRESSMRALVAATATVGATHQLGPGSFRVGSFVFESSNGQWRFSKAYLP